MKLTVQNNFDRVAEFHSLVSFVSSNLYSFDLPPLSAK